MIRINPLHKGVAWGLVITVAIAALAYMIASWVMYG